MHTNQKIQAMKSPASYSLSILHINLSFILPSRNPHDLFPPLLILLILLLIQFYVSPPTPSPPSQQSDPSPKLGSIASKPMPSHQFLSRLLVFGDMSGHFCCRIGFGLHA